MAYLIVIYYLSKNDVHNYKISDMVGKLASMVISLRTNNCGQ